jgi:homoaconitase/3-isopropylmalate dehydratase large subunit
VKPGSFPTRPSPAYNWAIQSGIPTGSEAIYAGEAVEDLDIDERATMTNMAAEVGAFTGLIRPDEKAVEFLVRERGANAADTRAALLAGLHPDEAQSTRR